MALEQNLPGINQNDLFLNAFDWEPKMAIDLLCILETFQVI